MIRRGLQAPLNVGGRRYPVRCPQRSFSSTLRRSLTADGHRLILGIESSCDDSCISLVSAPTSYSASSIASSSRLEDHGPDHRATVLAAVAKRQDHSSTKGIQPLRAHHNHAQSMMEVLRNVLKDNQIAADGREVDAVAVTVGPGMAGCLAEGLASAKAVAVAWNKPLILVHHMAAHALTPFFTQDFPLDYKRHPPIRFPYLTFLVSGGHSLLVLVSAVDSYRILADCHDMTIGQCLDSISRNLEVDVDWTKESPGAALERFANSNSSDSHSSDSQSQEKFTLTIPMPNKPEFSFAGSYTSSQNILQALVDEHQVKEVKDLPLQIRREAARAFQAGVFAQIQKKVELVRKGQDFRFREERDGPAKNSKKGRKGRFPSEWEASAEEIAKCQDIVISGGVASNSTLRRMVEGAWTDAGSGETQESSELGGLRRRVHYPPIKYCVDNAAMIAHVGHLLYDDHIASLPSSSSSSSSLSTEDIITSSTDRERDMVSPLSLSALSRPKWSLEEINLPAEDREYTPVKREGIYRRMPRPVLNRRLRDRPNTMATAATAATA